jgi:SAM-dependent methyltransferase
MTDGDTTTAAVARLLDDLAKGLPPPLVLIRLLGCASSEDEARTILDAASSEADHAGERLAAVRAVWLRHPGAHTLVRDVLSDAKHVPATGRPDVGVAGWADTFDRLAARHPEAGVALYALGDPALLAAATGELVDALMAWGDVRTGGRVLDLGCGIGRLAKPLVASGAVVMGADISEGMLREARLRVAAAGLALPLVRVAGRDLAAFADASFDTVLAIDMFPYLVLAGGGLAARHVAEAARVLRPGGRLVIANVSYRGTDETDIADLAAWSAPSGLELLAPPARPFTAWDGLVFRLGKTDGPKAR